MIYIGTDISKYKHDCFICNDTDEVIVENFSFENTKIGLEATGHYGLNLKLFLEKNNYSFMEFDSSLVKEFKKSLTLRRTKTDKVDVIVICQKLMSVPFKPNSKLFYHKYSIKSLSRLRDSLVKQKSKYMVKLTNILDIVFPEFKSFFNNRFSSTSLYLLNKYRTAEKITNMRDFDTPNKLSKGHFTYAKFAKLKELAKNSIGKSNEVFEIELQTLISLYNEIDSKINSIDKQISTIIKELNLTTLSIPGIGELTTAVIISEYGDFNRFSNEDKLLSFAGLEPSIYQSGTILTNGKMVKRGSGYLRYSLMNIANVVIRYNPIFYDFYLKKRFESKNHRVALSHVCKKLLRVIYKLETQNINLILLYLNNLIRFFKISLT